LTTGVRSGLETALDLDPYMPYYMEGLIAGTGGLEAVIHNNQAKTDANLKEIENMANLDAHHERMTVRMASQLGLSS
jgi:hypothetical protein